MENISLRANLKESWDLLKTNYKVLLPVSLFMGVASYLGKKEDVLLSLISLLVSVILQTGFIKMTLDILDGKNISIKEIFSQKDKFIRYIWMSILSVLIIGGPIVLAGIIFLAGSFSTQALSLTSFGLSAGIMSAVILATMFFIVPRMMFANVALIDNNEKAWQSIKTSFFITKDKKLQTIFLFFIVIFLNILGAALFYLGLLITIPLTQLMLSKYYRQISGKLMPTTEEIPVDVVNVEQKEPEHK